MNNQTTRAMLDQRLSERVLLMTGELRGAMIDAAMTTITAEKRGYFHRLNAEIRKLIFHESNMDMRKAYGNVLAVVDTMEKEALEGKVASVAR